MGEGRERNGRGREDREMENQRVKWGGEGGKV